MVVGTLHYPEPQNEFIEAQGHCMSSTLLASTKEAQSWDRCGDFEGYNSITLSQVSGGRQQDSPAVLSMSHTQNLLHSAGLLISSTTHLICSHSHTCLCTLREEGFFETNLKSDFE